MLGSNCNLKMHVQNLEYLLPLQIGGHKTTYLRRLQLNGNLTTYTFGSKHDIDSRLSASTTTRGPLRRLKVH